MPFHWPGFNSLGQLSAEETAELAARMADLTRAGLPLGDGLRALSGELSGRRLRRVLGNLADQLDAGADLATAVDSQSARLPTCLRGLVLAGLRSGRLAETLEEYVDLQRSQADLRRRLWLTLAYPLVLLILVTVFMVGIETFPDGTANVIRSISSWRNGPNPMEASLLPMWRLAMHGFPLTVGTFAALSCMSLVVLVSIWLAPSVRWAWALLRVLPMIGRMIRWGELARFARLTGMLLDQRVPLPDALRLGAAGLHVGELPQQCHEVAGEVEQGVPLYQSMAARRQFPATMIPLVEWGQRTAALADSFRAVAEMYAGRAESQDRLLQVVLPPMLFLLLLALVLSYAAVTLVPTMLLLRSWMLWF
ncbi:MAG: type II secretion system F family protein [Thermoguttaceae bacterium]